MNDSRIVPVFQDPRRGHPCLGIRAVRLMSDERQSRGDARWPRRQVLGARTRKASHAGMPTQGELGVPSSAVVRPRQRLHPPWGVARIEGLSLCDAVSERSVNGLSRLQGLQRQPWLGAAG